MKGSGHRIGDPINTLAWQRALAARSSIEVITFEPADYTLRVVVQAAASQCAIPVRLFARVSRQWHDVFDFEVDPHPIKTGRTSMERVIEIITEHATGLAYRTAVARDQRELDRGLRARRRP